MLDKDSDTEADAAQPVEHGSRSVTQHASDSSRTDITKGLHAVGTIAAQTTLVASLLFYFGWARTQAILGYFGINAAVARLSFNDYVLRSLNVAVKLLVILGLLALILLAGHRYLFATLTTRRHSHLARTASLTLVIAGAVACIGGLLGFYNWVIYSTRYPFVPIFLAAGITFLSYGFYIRTLGDQGPGENGSENPKANAWPIKKQSRPKPETHGWTAQFQIIVTLLIDIALIFWAVAVYANVAGQQAGKELASNLEVLPKVVVYSETSLGLTDPGVRTELIGQSITQYRYRYSNLRLLLYSAGRYLLIPDTWKQGRDPVFLLQEGNGIRFEFYGGP
jgi:hypothetical protein